MSPLNTGAVLSINTDNGYLTSAFVSSIVEPLPALSSACTAIRYLPLSRLLSLLITAVKVPCSPSASNHLSSENTEPSGYTLYLTLSFLTPDKLSLIFISRLIASFVQSVLSTLIDVTTHCCVSKFTERV